MDTQSTEASLARNKIYIDKMKERLLGTLPETLTKETNMFHDDCFAIPTPKCNPYPYKNGAGTSTVGPINMAVTLPTQQDPAAKGKDHLLSRAVTALSDKDFELRKLYNLIPDDDPETIKDFIQRIKDGKFTTDLTEKEQAESKFYSTQRLLEEIMWQDPARKEDDEGFKAAQKVLRQAYNDVCDEIVVKTPDQGLESLRAFQAKTFN